MVNKVTRIFQKKKFIIDKNFFKKDITTVIDIVLTDHQGDDIYERPDHYKKLLSSLDKPDSEFLREVIAEYKK